MATTEVSICNLALLRVGQRDPITSLDPTTDPSENAAICAVMYPAARDALLARFRWPFATRARILAVDEALFAGQEKAVPGWCNSYFEPADILVAQYLFDGVRPGVGLPLALTKLFGVPAIGNLPAIDGSVLPAAFEHQAGHILTDYADTPAAWDATVTYALNAVVSSGTSYYRSIQDVANLNHPVSDGAWWSAALGPASAVLVYTAALTDPTLFPVLFQEALAWRLSADLALSLATKPQLATALEQQAERAYQRAITSMANARQADRRPDSEFIAVRR